MSHPGSPQIGWQRDLDRARSGDFGAFVRLSDGCRRRVLAAVHGTLEDPQEVDDVIQGTLEIAWKSLQTYDPDQSGFCTWLYGIARNISRETNRKTRREVVHPVHDSSAEMPDANNVIDGKDDLLYASWLLRQLEPDTREAIVLRELMGLTYSEIATATESELNTVRTRIHRGRRQLLKLHHDGEEADD